jgi:hypothetical protein
MNNWEDLSTQCNDIRKLKLNFLRGVSGGVSSTHYHSGFVLILITKRSGSILLH